MQKTDTLPPLFKFTGGNIGWRCNSGARVKNGRRADVSYLQKRQASILELLL